MFRLGQASPPPSLAEFGKAAQLHALARAGLPVPAGWVLLPDDSQAGPPHEALAPRLEALGPGPWILRMCLAREDGTESSLAGMGSSVGALSTPAAIEGAWARLQARARELSAALGGRELRWAVLAQRDVTASHLAVCLHSANCPRYVELHEAPGHDALESGRSPDWSGPVEHCPLPSAAELAQILEALEEIGAAGAGYDAELVLDEQGWWVVQRRPLVRELFGDWRRFVGLLDVDEHEALMGQWVLDAEHNPAPLSTAHRWLLDRLRAARPGQVGEPRTFNGWLYLRRALRELAPEPSSTPAIDPAAHLVNLVERDIPLLRVRVTRFESSLEAGRPAREILDEAEALFLEMADHYASSLMPARKAAEKRARALPQLAANESHSALTTLAHKAAHLDVLPVEWDIESESLAEHESLLPSQELPGPATPELDTLDPRSLALCLGEWDDHYFAWGLRPMRSAFLHLAERLQIAPGQAFASTGDELVALEADPQRRDAMLALWTARRELRLVEATLSPPARIVDGLPYPSSGQRQRATGRGLEGVGIGEPFCGELTHRTSLGDLIAHPPLPTQVVCLPALTAPAAWVLHRLSVRAVCTHAGGAASHGSLMARELGLSAIIGSPASADLLEGTRVELDTLRGHIRRPD